MSPARQYKRSGLRLLNLQLARFNMGWAQERLAKESGISRTAISAIEAGKSMAKAATAKKLATALGIEVWQLCSDEGRDLSGQETGS